MYFNFYKINGSWILELINENNESILKSLFEDTVTQEEIINTAITLGKSDSISVNINFTENK